MKCRTKILGSFLLVLGVLILCAVPLLAQDTPVSPPTMSFRHPVAFAVTPPLRELAKLPQPPRYGFHESDRGLWVNFHPGRYRAAVVDPVEQSSSGGPTNAVVGLNLLGVGTGFPNYSVPDAPPDTNAAVGDTQVVEWVNTSFAIFNKTTGAIEAGPIEGNTLWSSLGGVCLSQNDGDIISQWDKVAHRWLLAQNTFATPYTACIAVSQTPDATGAYYEYAFSLGTGFPDYPKYGIWPTGYFETMNNFGPGGSRFEGAEVCAYNSAKLLVGDHTAEQICFQLTANDYSILPGDRDSPSAPPSGQDEFFLGSYDVDSSNNHLYLYSMHPVFPNPSQSTFVGSGLANPITVPTYSPYDPSCDPIRGACIPEPGGVGVAPLSDRVMYRLAYWNDLAPATTKPGSVAGPRQHWYVNHVVSASGGQAGVRWYEFRAAEMMVTLSGLSVYQSGTYAPDSNSRWLASMAQDNVGDVLVGYSLSSTTVDPSVAAAGRLKTDPLGTLEAEVPIFAGTGTQTLTDNRWGDYSSMAIDGSDNCTFWYAQEYYTVPNTQFDWSTRVASLKFSNCH
jgi:hypothetical protein